MAIKGEYPASQDGNFSIMDTIGVPHPYCITPEHLEYCGSMYLDQTSIERAESKGARCDICKKAVKAGRQTEVLTYSEHEQALLVECRVGIEPVPPELHDWLLSIKDEAAKNGYVGFAFKEVKHA